jgi:hypothetical protein
MRIDRAIVCTPAHYGWQVCVHEAGHVVAALLGNLRIESARVWPLPHPHSGNVRWMYEYDDSMKRRIRVHMGGAAAEVIFFGRHMIPALGSDSWKDFDQARACTERQGRVWDPEAAVKHAVTFLRPYRQGIERVARALQARGELSGDQVRRVIRYCGALGPAPGGKPKR